MQPQKKHSWITPSELKNHLTKKLGPERSNQYFNYLNKFLSFKLSKLEFDKLCLQTIGRDNISLHNQLIRLILKNACAGKIPPAPTHDENGSVPVGRTPAKEASTRFSLHAPLGISISGAHKASTSTNNNNNLVGLFENGGLIETIKLKEHIERFVLTQGLQGVSMDCARVLNNGLDAYLKRLIRSFPQLSGSRSRSTREQMKTNSVKHHINSRPLNGVRSGQYYQIQEHEPKCEISLTDLMLAMELNPQQLGEDWPVLLEKICTHAIQKQGGKGI